MASQQMNRADLFPALFERKGPPGQLVRRTLLLLLLSFLVPCKAAAKEEPQQLADMGTLLEMSLEELINVEMSLATGTTKPVRLAPSVATVITAEDIERVGATTLDEALETVPGLHVVPSGLNRFSSIYSFRGIHTGTNPHVLLMINGMRLQELYNSTRPPTFRMPVSMVSRIEVIRGPGSAVHGADAFSGVINVITKSAREINGTRAGIRAGSFDTYDSWAQHGGEYRGWQVATGFEWQKSEGDDGRIISSDALGSGSPSLTPTSLDTRYENFDAHLALTKGNLSFTFYGSQQRENAMGPGSQYITDLNRQNNQTLLGKLAYRRTDLIKNWDLNTNLSGSYIMVDSFWQITPATAGNIIGWPITPSYSSSLNLFGIYNGFAQHRIRLGTGGKLDDMDTDAYKNFGHSSPGKLLNVKGTSYIYCDNQNRHSWYGLVQDEWSFARDWELTAGVRFDEYSDFGSTVNPRAALVWQTRPDLTTKLLYGTAFRPPSFSELYGKNNPVALGNPDLEPETMEMGELAFSYQLLANLHTGINIFYYEVDDLIDYVGDTTKTAENVRNQKGYGYELEADWRATPSFNLRSNLSFQRARDQGTDALVADAPGIVFYLNPHWKFRKEWSLDAQFYWIADRHRDEDDDRDELADYGLVNLTLRRRNIFDKFDIAVAVRNLFDKDGRIPSDGRVYDDYPMEGRSVWTELSYRF